MMRHSSRAERPAPALTRVARGDLCAGCGACAAIAPGRVAMAMTSPGYLRPEVSGPITPEENAAIARVCPGLGQRVTPAGRETSVLWGPYRSMVTGWSTDPDLRHAGASGGALSALLLHLLYSGTVDAVVTNLPAEGRPLGNVTRVARNRADLLTAAGSRYAPSAPLAGLLAYLEDYRTTGCRFAFVGKPCDVAAIAALRAEDSEIAQAFPVLLSFFCAGVPSETGARKILEALEISEAELTAFRYRGNGWPGRATVTLTDGSTRSMSYHDSWGGILSKHVQHRCKICADGTGKAADLVCADAWESDENGYPVFEERPGVSLIVARTALGTDVLASAREAGHLETRPYDIDDLATIQPGQRERRRALLARLSALRLVGRPVPVYEGLQIVAAAQQNPLRRNLHNFLGTLRRALRSKLSKSRTER